MRKSLFSLLILMAANVWAHGEDKLGPNGGFISMPGAFHVELVPIKSNQLKVYLLDIEWKNPIVKESGVKLTYGSIVAKCKSKTDHFVCDFPATVDLNKTGELSVAAFRKNQKGMVVKYSLPLKLKSTH